jgi:hypothetical protein
MALESCANALLSCESTRRGAGRLLVHAGNVEDDVDDDDEESPACAEVPANIGGGATGRIHIQIKHG